MSFLDMSSELAEAIPGLSRVYAKTLINRAWRVVRDSNLWSFQLQNGGFATPGITTSGTISATMGSTTIIGDAAASAAWAALPFIFSPTVQQIRATGYSIYNIIAYKPGANLPYDFVLQQAPPGYPTALILADTITGTHYSISFRSGAFQLISVGTSGTPSAGPIFLDASTGLKWQLQVTNGALDTTVVTGAAVSQYILQDTISGYEALMVSGGALEWISVAFPTVNYSFSVINGAFEYIDIGPLGTPIPNPIFRDGATGLFWQISVVSGALTLTEVSSPSSFVLSIPVADAVTSAGYAFQVTASSFGIVATGLSNFAQLTLDRPFIDPLPSYTGIGYQMFLAYIPAPKQFKRWLNVGDLFNCYPLDIHMDRRSVNQVDPARLYTSNPYALLGLGTDQRPGSATLGQQLYELYPTPSTAISYATYYVIQSPDLVLNSDELPYPITQEVVLSKARVYAYEWAEARKDVMAAKGSGANYGQLKKEGEAEFRARLHTLRLIDKDQVDSFNFRMNSTFAGYQQPFFNAATGRATMGLR